MPDNIQSIFWLVLTVFFIVAESNSAQVVAIWFALGGIAATLAAVGGWLGFRGQLTLFLLISLLALAISRPFVKNLVKLEPVPTNADQLLGQQAIVVKRITPREKGRVHINGLDWSAAADCEIEAGASVVVESIEGVTLIVKKYYEE